MNTHGLKCSQADLHAHPGSLAARGISQGSEQTCPFYPGLSDKGVSAASLSTAQPIRAGRETLLHHSLTRSWVKFTWSHCCSHSLDGPGHSLLSVACWQTFLAGDRHCKLAPSTRFTMTQADVKRVKGG